MTESWHGYYINLDRAAERRSRIENQLRQFGLSDRYTRHPATDGRTLARKSLRGPGEVGIFRSHLDVLERIAASGRTGHVIEDDVVFCDLTAPAIDAAIERSVVEDFDIVFLETYVGEAIPEIRIYHRMFQQATQNGPIETADQLQILNLNEGYQSGSTSYVVSARKAGSLAALLRQHWDRGPNLPVDMLYQREVRAGRLQVGCIFPFVTTVDFVTSWASEAERHESLDRAMLQRLIRYTFFARRDIAGEAEPVLDQVLARLPPPVSGEAMTFYSRIVQYLLTAPPDAPEVMTDSPGVKTRRLAVGDRAAFTVDDAAFLAEFPVLFLTAAFVPESRWQRVTFRLEQLKSALGRFSLDKIRGGLTMIRGVDRDPDDAVRVAATRSEHHLQIIRDQFFGWSAPVELVGGEHVSNALVAGHGAVFWVAHFSFNALASKKALHEAGFQVSHLSRPEHGFSKSRFGVAVLNPIRVNAELRYLKDRIIIERAKPTAAVTRAQKRLRENGLISITAGAWEGAKIATVDVRGCALDLSTGAPGLAAMTGAALLPVFTVRDPGETQIQVIVGEPIPVDRGASRDEKLLNATQTFADRLGPYVDRYPLQWRDWEKVRRKDTPPLVDSKGG